ncbi:MAG: hypothetical protein AAGH70_01140 [Pseudomonadota bacterium]
MRGILLSLLTVLTVVTSAGLGHARGLLPAQEGIVICQGHLAVTIWIDAQGNEITQSHICPDAALSLLGQGGVEGPALTTPWGERVTLWAIVAPDLSIWALPPRGSARAPPASV